MIWRHKRFFKRVGSLSMKPNNRISENCPRGSMGRGVFGSILFACLASLVPDTREAVAAGRELTIGITQFPSTLNPNIDVMAAKSYVLGAALRPFTVYDADLIWPTARRGSTLLSPSGLTLFGATACPSPLKTSFLPML
jgi:hypothetical protein